MGWEDLIITELWTHQKFEEDCLDTSLKRYNQYEVTAVQVVMLQSVYQPFAMSAEDANQ